MKLERVLIMLLCVLTSSLLISSTVGIAWGKYEHEYGTTFIGLWKSCEGKVCHRYKESTVEGWWYAIRANMVLSLLISFSGFILSFTMILNNNLNSCYLACIYGISGILAATGLAIWRSKIIAPYQVAYSYVLGWVGFVIIILVIFGCALEQIRRTNKEKQKKEGDLQHLNA